MKSSNIKYLLIFAVGLLVSCNLDELPTGQVVAESAITDAKTAENALNGVYYQFASAGVNVYDNKAIFWSRTHELLPAQIAGIVYYRYGGLGFGLNMNAISFSNFSVEEMWTSRYETIAAANAVISKVEALPEDEFEENRKKEIIGEAKFLRAYANFSLLSYFGKYYDTQSPLGIILRDELTQTTTIVKPRSTVEESYNAILEDLDYAIANAPIENEKFYATQWAAKLLKARVLLYRGADNDYAQANSLALDVINNGPYQLDNMKALFTTNGLTSTGVILGLVPGIYQLEHQSNYLEVDRGPSYLAEPHFIDVLGNDPRAEWLLDTITTGETIITKYRGVVPEVCYAFRLTEAYLIASETFARMGDEAQSKNYLKAVKEKSGITDFTAIETASGNDLLFEIFKEYTINMSLEDGHEWFALTRCLPFEKVMEFRPGILSKEQYILPIPELEITRNSEITQNPGYETI